MAKIKPDEIHLERVRILETTFHQDPSIEIHSMVDFFDVGIRSESRIAREMGVYHFVLFLKLRGMGDGQELGVSANFKIDFLYEVENFQNFLQEENTAPGGFKVNRLLASTIAGISYSTARGLILEKIRTNFELSFILPIVDPVKILADDTYSQNVVKEDQGS